MVPPLFSRKLPSLFSSRSASPRKHTRAPRGATFHAPTNLDAIIERVGRSEEARAKDGQRLVGIREFIESPDYADRGSEVWPGVMESLEQMTAPGIQGAIVEMGIGGGKSFRLALLLSYLLYRLSYSQAVLGQNPRAQWDLAADAMISVANVSKDQKNAKRVVFGYIASMIDSSPWFKEYMPRDKTCNSELRFPHGYSIFPGHGHQSSVIGLNLYACVIDEANFFTLAETSGIDYVEEMYDAIESRLRSRFGLDGFLGVISSRRTVNDFTARKRRALQDDPDTAKRYFLPPPRPAWEDWPEGKKARWNWKAFDQGSYKFSTGPHLYADIKEPEDRAQAEADARAKLPQKKKGRTGQGSPLLWVPETLWGPFATNPESSLRDHASIPSDAICPYIRRRDLILPDFGDPEQGLPPMVSPVLPTTKPRDWMNTYVDFDRLVSDDFWGDPNSVYHFHVDLSKTKDATGLAITCNAGTDAAAWVESEGRPERAALIEVSAIICIQAPPNGEISFSRVREILYWLKEVRGFRFRKCSFDGWQSTDSIQILQSKGFDVEILSVDRNLDAYDTLKDALYEGRLFFPPAHGQDPYTTWDRIYYLDEQGDPCARFQRELAQLELISDKRVDHPPTGSKDLTDAVAGAVYWASQYRRNVTA